MRWCAALRAACVVWGIGAAALCGVAGDGLEVRAVRDAERTQLPPPDMDPFLGVVLDEHGGTALVAEVVPGSSAHTAKIAPGDVLERVDSAPVTGALDLEKALRDRGIGARVRVALRRAGNPVDVVVTLGRRRKPDECFRQSRFELAVVPLRFADDAPLAKGAPSAESARLARLIFAKSGATGAGASLSDYYRNQSYGRLDVGGRVLAPIALPRGRAQYADQPMGGGADSAFAAAAALLAEREGFASMTAFDGVAFLYAGEPESRPGFALWPHRASVDVGAKRIPYYVHASADAEAASIGVHCHEFGHLLGLPDAYGTGHVTGCGDFCLMAIGHRGGERDGAHAPFSLCAWCRVRLGWLEPVAVDPRTPQRLRLGPVASGPGEALLVPLNSRTDEYLLLEVRRREGFDAELPSAGLLVWHIGGAATPGQARYGSYVDLVEAHGIDTVDASLVRTGEIAFPTSRARDLTLGTFPAIVASAPDAFAVHLTDIQTAPGGAVDVTLGVLRRIAQAPPAPHSSQVPAADGYVVRLDPITGREVRLYVGTLPGPPVPEPTHAEERR